MESKRVVKNASWIIVGRVGQSLLGLIVSMLSARYLGPSNFGLIGYASSIVAFVAPIMQLGLNSILVQEIVSNPEDEGKILGTSFMMSMISAFLCIAGILSFVFITSPNEKETLIVCGLYSLILIFQALDLVRYWFQAKLLSKFTSIVSLCAYVVVSLYKIFLLATAKSIYWFAISNTIDYILISISLLVLYHRLDGRRFSVSFDLAKRMFSKSKYFIVSGLMVTVFAQTDKIMLKLMINDSANGFYTAGVACAGMTGFVFVAIIDSFRPIIFENKIKNEASYNKSVISLYCVIFYLSIVQSIVMSVFATIVIRILYGDAFAPAADALRIIVWYTTFSYMGGIRDIWMLSEGKQSFIWKINLIGAILNVILNAILIPKFSIVGAAVASLFTQFFTNFILGFILSPIKDNNKLLLEGLNPKYLIEIAKRVKKS